MLPVNPMHAHSSRRGWLPTLGKAALLGGAAALLLAGCACRAVVPQAGFVDIIRQAAPAVVAISDARGLHGAGFRLADTAWVVTAAHTVQSAQGGVEIVWNETKWPAQILNLDKQTDLALLQLPPEASVPGLHLANQADVLAEGEWIVVLGRPFGVRPTATVGIVSGLPGAVTAPEFLRTRLQLNAAVNPGNSGGPVLNLQGRVIGVANATVPGGHGLGFATPAAAVRNLLEN